MSILLAQIVLAGRNEDVDGWMNILVVVVLAVFWALGGIIKARKIAQSRQKEPLARRPVRRPAPQTTMLREQLLKGSDRYAAPAGRRPAPARSSAEQTRTKLAEWRAAARKFADEAEQAFRAQMAETPPESPPQTSHKLKPQFAAQETPEFAAKLSITPEKPPARSTPETQPEEYLTELLADYADSDQLRRAILHYEILGRPLSLREPGGSAIGL